MDIRFSNKLILVFILALVIRIINALFFIDAGNLLIEDQMMYIELGKKLTEKGIFQFFGSDYLAITDRVPGYPLLLGLIYKISGDNNLIVLIVQAIIDSFTCVLIGLTSEKLLAKSFFISGLISALNLNMIVLSGMILTDTLFLFFFTIFIFFILNYLKNQNSLEIFLAISFLCLASLVRPISYYLIFLMFPLLIVFFVIKKMLIKKILLDVFLYLIVIFIAFSHIHKRNYFDYDTFSLTSQGGGHTLYWVVPATYQYSGKGSYEDGRKFAQNYLDQSMMNDNLEQLSENPFERSNYQMRISKDALAELGLKSIVHAWSAVAMINLITPSAAYAPIVRQMDHPSFYETPGNGAVEKLINYATNTDGMLYLSILSIGSSISIFFIIVSLFGFYKMTMLAIREKNNRYIIFLLLFFIIYFVAITGPIVGVKYRLPIEPILTLFFSYSFIFYFSNRKTQNN